MKEEKRVTVEDILGEFGFRVRWRVDDYWASVEVYEVVAIECGTERILFAREDQRPPSNDDTDNVDEAEKYLEGFIKWDGCTELNQGRPHWCGPDGYKKHIALLEYIYKRAFELMGREPEERWE
jgi:hypothetical protein